MEEEISTEELREQLLESIDDDLSEEDRKFIMFICLLDNRPRIPQTVTGIWTEVDRKYGATKAAHLLQFAISSVISKEKVSKLTEPYDPSLEQWWLRDEKMAKVKLRRACMILLDVPDEGFDLLSEKIVSQNGLQKGVVYKKNDLKFYKDMENRLFIKPSNVSNLIVCLEKSKLFNIAEDLQQYQNEGNLLEHPCQHLARNLYLILVHHLKLRWFDLKLPSQFPSGVGYPMRSWSQTTSHRPMVDQSAAGASMMQSTTYVQPGFPPTGEVQWVSEQHHHPPNQGRQYSMPTYSSGPRPQLERRVQSYDEGHNNRYYEPGKHHTEYNYPPHNLHACGPVYHQPHSSQKPRSVSDPKGGLMQIERNVDKERRSASFHSEPQFTSQPSQSNVRLMSNTAAMQVPQSSSSLSSASTTHSRNLSSSGSFPEDSPPQSDPVAVMSLNTFQPTHHTDAAQHSIQPVPPHMCYQSPSPGHNMPHHYQVAHDQFQPRPPPPVGYFSPGNVAPHYYHHQQQPVTNSSSALSYDYAQSVHSSQGHRSSCEEAVVGQQACPRTVNLPGNVAYQQQQQQQQQCVSSNPSYNYVASAHSNQDYSSSRVEAVVGQLNDVRTAQADCEDHPRTVFPNSSYSQPYQ